MEALKYLAVIIIAYLLGSVSVAVVITKYIMKKDVREQGSGNAGATNVARVFGMRLGVLTLLGDCAKTALSMLIGHLFLGYYGVLLGAAACFIGHMWPVYFRFKGGKGIAVGGAAALILDYRMFLIVLSVFILVFLLSRIVSAASISAAAMYPVSMLILGVRDPYTLALGLFFGVSAILLHRKNIVLLIQGKEKKFRPGGGKNA